MKSIRRTVLEAFGLLVFALVIAFSANELRGSGRIKPGKNYFDRGMSMTQPASTPSITPKQAEMPKAEPVAENGPTASPAAKSNSAAGPVTQHAEHPFQKATFEDVKAAFEDPGSEVGLNVFVDARNDDTFEAGHIPGAIVCNPYEVENYIDRVLSGLGNAEKIFVYCGGGDCEDSIFLCRELMTTYKVPFNNVYLFEGGWKEWTQHNMPTQTGSGE